MEQRRHEITVWPLAVYYFALVSLLVAEMLAPSYILGQRHNQPATGAQYESLIHSEGQRSAAVCQVSKLANSSTWSGNRS